MRNLTNQILLEIVCKFRMSATLRLCQTINYQLFTINYHSENNSWLSENQAHSEPLTIDSYTRRISINPSFQTGSYKTLPKNHFF